MNVIERLSDKFEPALLDELSKVGRVQSVAANEQLLEVGQIVTMIPIVLSGSVKISRTDENGRELLLYYINPNEGCAMTFTCCMQLQKSEIKAITEEPTEFISVPVDIMDKWITKYPSWKSFVMTTIRNRFNELIKTIDQLSFQKLDERLIHYLKEKAELKGSKVINLSHEQIATDLATSRVVISRLLKSLENDKKVVLYRNQIKLLSQL